jgi:hypothetical protein
LRDLFARVVLLENRLEQVAQTAGKEEGAQIETTNYTDAGRANALLLALKRLELECGLDQAPTLGLRERAERVVKHAEKHGLEAQLATAQAILRVFLVASGSAAQSAANNDNPT